MTISWIETYRLVIFVPTEEAETFIKKIEDAIPSFLGHYDRVCWWSAPGTEQARALEGANPVSGKIGQTIKHPSTRVEFSLPKDRALLNRILTETIIPAHPWEEPVILLHESEIADIADH